MTRMTTTALPPKGTIVGQNRAAERGKSMPIPRLVGLMVCNPSSLALFCLARSLLDGAPGTMQDIGDALRTICNLPHKAFAMIIQDAEGHLVSYTTPALRTQEEAIFNEETCDAFSHAVRQAEAEGRLNVRGPGPMMTIVVEGEMPSRPRPGVLRAQSSGQVPEQSPVTTCSRRSSVTAFGTEEEKKVARGRKASARRTNASSGNGSDLSTAPMIQIRIDDAKALDDFYLARFNDLQQLFCKIVAKAWIRKIEPRKQTTYPYKDGALSAPPWWPSDVEHREPDHIRKQERMRLLHVMLLSTIQPVAQLQEATDAVQDLIAVDKRPILQDIYRVAKYQERFRNGVIGPETYVAIGPSPEISKTKRDEYNRIGPEEEVDYPIPMEIVRHWENTHPEETCGPWTPNSSFGAIATFPAKRSYGTVARDVDNHQSRTSSIETGYGMDTVSGLNPSIQQMYVGQHGHAHRTSVASDEHRIPVTDARGPQRTSYAMDMRQPRIVPVSPQSTHSAHNGKWIQPSSADLRRGCFVPYNDDGSAFLEQPWNAGQPPVGGNLRAASHDSVHGNAGLREVVQQRSCADSNASPTSAVRSNALSFLPSGGMTTAALHSGLGTSPANSGQTQISHILSPQVPINGGLHSEMTTRAGQVAPPQDGYMQLLYDQEM